MQPAVFLDLDNTIIETLGRVPELDSIALIKGAAPAIASLRGLGYRIVVAANREGVARGWMAEDDVQAIHSRVAELVEQTASGAVIDAFYYCPFHPKGEVEAYKKDAPTRKPRPGMLQQASEDLSLDLSRSWMIGDELADVQAGHAAGARTILLRPDAERLMPVDPSTIAGVIAEAPDHERPTGPDFYAVGLVDAARLIAQQPRVEQVEGHKPQPGRKWDAEKIAKIQVPRPPKSASQHDTPPPTVPQSFRPWGAPAKEDDGPIVTKPFLRRHQADSAVVSPSEAVSHTPADPPPVSQDIPAPIRQAIEKKKASQAHGDEPNDDKTLRLILHELRAQRGKDEEFSFLTIVAVALQLVAIICLLGGLFMGGGSDGLFLRWLGVAVVAQLTSIATLQYGR